MRQAAKQRDCFGGNGGMARRAASAVLRVQLSATERRHTENRARGFFAGVIHAATCVGFVNPAYCLPSCIHR